MSRKIDHFIAELIAEDMVDINKLKKNDLKQLARQLLESNYRELHNDTIVELYEEKFHTYVR
jgi:septin family protein